MSPYFWFVYLLDYILCIILSFSFTYYYANKKVPKLIIILCNLFLFANYLLIFTLPYEIVYYNVRQEALKKSQEKNITLNYTNFYNFVQNYSNKTNTTDTNITSPDIQDLKNLLNINYGIIFWVLVTFSNQVIFYFIYFEESGEFTFWRKIFDSIKRNLIRTILTLVIIAIIAIVLGSILASLFVYFNIITIAYAFVFLGLSIIKLPRNMHIHSNHKLALEYYEFKANKKAKELDKNNEELKKNYFMCKQTFVYIKNIEEFLNKNKNQEDLKDEKSEKSENTTTNDDDNLKNIISINNINNKLKNEKDEENNKKEGEKDDIKKNEKDYKKHKSILKYKQYIDELYSNLSEIIKRNKIKITDELNEGPIKEYKNIVAINAKSKQLDNDNERINFQIERIYKNWSFLKELDIKDKNVKIEFENNNVKKDNSDIEIMLKQDEIIPSLQISEKKINFYKKYNKPLFIFLMAFFIFSGIIIIISEISLVLPFNISLFSVVFKNMSNPIMIHIFCILLSSLYFMYVSYSFGKIKSMGKKYIIFGNKQTNSLGLLTYCQKLSSISFPVSMNIIKMIFYKNVDEKIKTTLEENYGNDVGNTSFYKFISFIPLFLIIVIIFYFFDIYGRIFKKKRLVFMSKMKIEKNIFLKEKNF